MVTEKYPSVVIGLGKTGYSCVDYYCRHQQPVAVVDHHASPALLPALQADFPDVDFVPYDQAATLLQQAPEWVVSPGVPMASLTSMMNANGSQTYLNDIELFCQAAQAPIIAITGSNGKTTVTTLVGEAIRRAGLAVEVCGNIGVPVLDALKKATPDYYVLELSSFQLEWVSSLSANVAVVLNISADHMDRYEDLSAYIAAKCRIFNQADHAIINADQRSIFEGLSLSHCVEFSSSRQLPQGYGVDADGDRLTCNHEPLMTSSSIACGGGYHRGNALVVFAIADLIGLPRSVVVETLQQFTGIPHRCQEIAIIEHVRWINDSKATNIGAAIAGIELLSETLAGELIVIMGGCGKQSDFSPLSSLADYPIKQVILIGQEASRMAKALPMTMPVCHASSLQDAVCIAFSLAVPNDVVVLSPACASFDMFDNYEHRGNVFVGYVEQLP